MAIDTRQENLRLSWEKGDDLVLSLDPLQGHWTEEQYLLLTDQTNRLLEYTDGYRVKHSQNTGSSTGVTRPCRNSWMASV